MHKTSAYDGIKVAVVCSTSGSGEIGGAERFYHGLLRALLDQGCDARIVNTPADESSYEQIQRNYEYCQNLDLSEFDLVISTKAPTYAINHPRHVLYLVHTTRVFYDMFDASFPSANKQLREQRQSIQKLDTDLISKVQKRFCIGHEVRNRLLQFNGLDSEVMHPPLAFSGFHTGKMGDYFFIPGRLHPWKRLDLLIKAIQHSDFPMKLVIAGTGEAEASLKSLAASDQRVEFLGRVSDEQLIELYANALAVPFVPVREDYGYITLEAFSAGKPVITCTDSGEPNQFVEDAVTGLICKPEPEDIARAMESLFSDRPRAREMGQNAKKVADKIQWQQVAEKLLEPDAAHTGEPVTTEKRKTRVTVLDMQPIDPPVGGGRLRLLGVYHDLGENFETRYVGSYDWEGEAFRRHQLSESLEEIDVPLSKEHHAAARKKARACGGKVVIDLSFPELGHLSEAFLKEARGQLEWADVVVFAHPWLYPLLREHLQPRQTLVYDSQNVESYLRAQILDQSNPTELSLLRNIIETECQLGIEADLVLACSHDDLNLFSRIYDWNPQKIKIIPNGVFTSRTLPPTDSQRLKARAALDVEPARAVAIFLGSNYGPNVEAAEFIRRDLASSFKDILFVIAGGVGGGLTSGKTPDNVVITGFLDEQDKAYWLQAADLAINPMFSGSGTNIKMFDFMASGLATISTEIGARGIESPGGLAIKIVPPSVEAFGSAMSAVLSDKEHREGFSQAARSSVEQGYSWEQISPCLGQLITKAKSDTLDGRLKFTVVIPSYERHNQLDELIVCLQQQYYKQFEVVIVDQSLDRWENAHKNYGFPLYYHHTTTKGAVRARNTGAQFAQGEIIAFTDDDCRPEPGWLENSISYFDNDDVVGVEGKIYSDHLDDPKYRPVTNVGFEGFGFMTANLLVRHAAFKLSGGFDLQFDIPHFREDTDLGWRLMAYGSIPYGSDVQVFHPAQRCDIERESSEERARFFEKDALLFKKHPNKYEQLFFAEGHWRRDNGFWENFTRGSKKYRVDIEKLSKYKPIKPDTR